MKYKLLRFGILFLIAYSSFILASELLFGQDYVRKYLTDIKGDVIFFGINTTLTTLFLALTAYNFFLCAMSCKKTDKSRKDLLSFFIVQSILFLFLALDERFMVHERIGFLLGFEDAYLLGLIGVFELVLLYRSKEIYWAGKLKSYALYLGGLLFGVMLIIDAFGADKGLLRLSFEDLSKTWAIFFLFIYSFETYRLHSKPI